jgi:hypothetical protein
MANARDLEPSHVEDALIDPVRVTGEMDALAVRDDRELYLSRRRAGVAGEVERGGTGDVRALASAATRCSEAPFSSISG